MRGGIDACRMLVDVDDSGLSVPPDEVIIALSKLCESGVVSSCDRLRDLR